MNLKVMGPTKPSNVEAARIVVMMGLDLWIAADLARLPGQFADAEGILDGLVSPPFFGVLRLIGRVLCGHPSRPLAMLATPGPRSGPGRFRVSIGHRQTTGATFCQFTARSQYPTRVADPKASTA